VTPAVPPARRPLHWAQVGETGAVAGMWLLYAVARVLGRWPFRLALAPVVLYYVLRQPLARAASLEYLTRLEAHCGALGHRPGWRDVFRHVNLFAETLLDKALAVGGRYPFGAMRFEGREVMLESLAAGRGGVLLTAHLGALEVLRAAAGMRVGLRLNVLVHTRHAERFNAVLRRLDPSTEINLLQVSEFSPGAAAALADRVERGEWVVIAGDRVPLSGSATGVAWVDFLGRKAPFPVGPWVLAAALHCQVILITNVHEGDSYRVRYRRLSEQVELPRATRQAALAAYVQDYARHLEVLCRASPYDWFNFYPFWESPHGPPPVA
jgi:predicted LPLAT superfamily acyltransferase